MNYEFELKHMPFDRADSKKSLEKTLCQSKSHLQKCVFLD